MDRVDIVLDISRTDPALLLDSGTGDDSLSMRRRVARVRERGLQRDGCPTAQLSAAALLHACALTNSARRAIESIGRTQRLSGRGVTRLLRVARTIADLEHADSVGPDHIAEAVSFRAKDDG